MSNPIGIFGGTFDPVHNGHLQTAAQAAAQLGFDQVRLMPCYLPPHKTGPATTQQQRLDMLELVARKNPLFRVDKRELNDEKVSYTVNTLRAMRQELPTTPLCFFMGMDSLHTFDRWVEWREILDLTHLVVCRRGDHPFAPSSAIRDLLSARQCSDPNRFRREQAGLIWLADTAELAISSSDIRQRISRGMAIDHMVPSYIVDYVVQHGLYLCEDKAL